MRIHFIAIGGAIMHNLAIALHHKGYIVTGSDDEIFEPALSRLKKYGLLPGSHGWDINKITPDLDAVILGMHALEDNPELQKAIKSGIRVYSFPAFMYEQTKNKKRIVIAGSHGKTTITSMILHVLKTLDKKFDYLAGSQIEGFETMVGISDDADIAVFEGDEYLTSALDRVPKFYHYKPHLAVLSGIAWDHFNVFPDFDNYISQFKLLIERIEPDGKLYFDAEDDNIKLLDFKPGKNIQYIPYKAVPYENTPHGTKIVTGSKKYLLNIFGKHNMKNISAALSICHGLGIDDDSFYMAMQNFKGAKKRLEILKATNDFTAYTDFAHAPSKVKATLSALKEKYPGRKIIAFFELHTFSSLNKKFLPQYAHSMHDAHEAYIFYNHEVIINKKLEDLNEQDIKKAFLRNDIIVINSGKILIEKIRGTDKKDVVMVFMSSGNFSGVDIRSLINNI